MKNKLSADGAIDSIEAVAGKFPGYRRAHAKGIGFEAEFKPNGAATAYTTAAHFQETAVPAIVRFSHSSPNPEATELLNPVKGMSVQFQLPNGEITNLANVTVPVFITKTPEAFIDMIRAVKKGEMGVKDRLEVMAKHPDWQAGFEILKNLRPPVSFATGCYYSIHAYYFINEHGERQAVKYEWEPDAGVELLSLSSAFSLARQSMEEEVEARLADGPIIFHLTIQLGEADDPTDDPTEEWPADRKKLRIGTLTITNKRADNAESIRFDPTIVPDGIECSEDPVLIFRSKAYAESYKRRINNQYRVGG
ncbi:catalase [Bacillus ectoiniformans]|uniref:catalase family peroxidase n=1 Tax=Bacillus ectoiniformans TaxID=1494429 RepID=UPI00308452F7|nr:catalase [Bacillus ectoiniformans]